MRSKLLYAIESAAGFELSWSENGTPKIENDGWCLHVPTIKVLTTGTDWIVQNQGGFNEVNCKDEASSNHIFVAQMDVWSYGYIGSFYC